jgi:hypothetical protein
MNSNKTKLFCCPFLITTEQLGQGKLFRAKCPAHCDDADWQCPLEYTKSIAGKKVGSCALLEIANKIK